MIFERNSDIEEELFDFLFPYDFIEYMKKQGEIKNPTDDYGTDVYGLCRNACAWIILRLKDTPYIYDISVVEGNFQGKDHAWIQIGDYYLDLTLAQFISSPSFAVVEVLNGNANGYEPVERLDVKDWLKNQSF